MASFVESATLAIKDDSTKKIDKINASLKKLYTTAKRVSKALDSLDFEPKGLSNASRRIGAVTASLNKLSKTKVRPTLDLSGVNSQLGKITSKNVQINVTANMRGLQSQLNNSRLSVNLKSAFEPLKGIGKEIARDIQQAIINGVVKGIKDGYSGIDVAETRILRQGISPGGQSNLNNAILSQERTSGNVFDRGQLLGIASEAAPMLNDNLTGIDVIMAQMSKIGTTLVGFGKSVQIADDGLNKYNKVAEQAGRMYDQTTGQFDPAKYTNFMDIINRAMIQFGKEIDANVVEQTFRALQGSKMSLNDAGIIALLGYMEEQRSTSGVATNQLIKQLSGDRIDKKRLANLIDMGLVQTREIEVSKTSKKGKVSTTTEREVTGVVDEELLRSNPLEWTNKHLVDAMVKKGLDPKNNTDINKFANMVTSDRTATAAVVTMLTRYQDFMRQAEKLQGLNMTPEMQQTMVDQSGLIAYAEASSKVTSFLGLMATSLETLAIPALQTFSGYMQQLNEFISPGGEVNGKNAGIVAGGGILGAIGAALGVKGAWGWLSGGSAQIAATNANTAALTANTAALGGGKLGALGATAATAGTMSAGATVGASILTLAGLYSALQNVNMESLKNKVSGAKGFTNWVTSFFDPALANDPNSYANSKPEPYPQAVQDWNAMVTRNGTAFAEAVKVAFANMTNDRTPVGVASQIALQSSLFPGKTRDDLGLGADSEASNLRNALTTGSENGATTLGGGIIQGAQTAAGILASAITKAAQGISIATSQAPTQIAPVDTGANPLARHH